MHFSASARPIHLPRFLRTITLSIVGLVGFAQAALATAPTISGTPASSVYVGSTYSFTPNAYDQDGQRLRFTIYNKPAWASFSRYTGRLRGTPSSVGLWSGVQIRVSDGMTSTALPSFSIRAISRSNVAPSISGTPPTTATVGTLYGFQPLARDSNGDPIVFSIANKPSWASFSSSTGRLSGTPSSSHVGTYSSIVIKASDGSITVSLPSFSITVGSASPTTNTAPTISGTPPSTVTLGSVYSFRPLANDVNGDTLGFSIQNKPDWASFSTSTGQLSGTPSLSGTHSDIIVSVSDGQATTSLTAFTITVSSSSSSSSGSATLSWTAPTQNTDGTALTDLAGYRIRYGTSAGVLSQTVQVTNAGLTTYVLDNLSPGTYYFAVTAYTTSNTESAESNVASKIVQ